MEDDDDEERDKVFVDGEGQTDNDAENRIREIVTSDTDMSLTNAA